MQLPQYWWVKVTDDIITHVVAVSFHSQYVFNLMPRGQYTSGKGSSAVGLTAYVTRDPETRQLVLQT